MSSRVPRTPGRSINTQLSTTPAGLPTWMQSHKSTTPPGDPPRSSRFNSSYNPRKSPDNRYARKASHGSFSVPEDDADDWSDDEEDAPGEDDDDFDAPPHFRPQTHGRKHALSFTSSQPPPLSPRGLKRDASGRVRENSGFAQMSKTATAKKPTARLREEDRVVVQSERVVSELDAKIARQPAQSDIYLSEAAAALTKLWHASTKATTKLGGIGPESEDSFTKANYLASLLLQLHHPHSQTLNKNNGRIPRSHSVPVPRALLDWLDAYHKPFPDDFETIHLTRPSASAHESFWDAVFASLLRGRVDRVIRLLSDAGWENADTALDDGASMPGYHGRQLENIEEVVGECIQTLGLCPGYKYGDWDVRSMDWMVFRQHAKSALDELEAFAEGDDLDESLASENVFQRSLGQSSLNLSTASRKASSKVPWTIYENLRLLYGIVLCQPEEILMTAQDWLEGTLYLTVWWDGADDYDLHASVAARSIRKNPGPRPREVDVAPLAAYRRRLADAFARVREHGQDGGQDDDQNAVFQVDSTDLVQVGLACVLEDEVGCAVGLLRTWSVPITVAVVELAALGGWVPRTESAGRDNALGQGLSKEDLLVLSYGAATPEVNPDDIDRDEILSEYATQLSGKVKVGELEGWELAVAVLNRLEQPAKAQTKIAELLDRLQLTSQDTVDKVLQVCDDLGQTEQKRTIAERYADNLAENTESYGPALIYYARAHAQEKLKDTVTLLISISLLHSTAMPTRRRMDDKLSALISRDRPALKDLARADLEAGTLLSSYLSGYATLRKFYDLRDQDVNGTDERPVKPLERRRQAATAVYAVLKSAADCIPGGLYDPEAESVIPVDGLLVLFGEALPFLGQPQRIFTQAQVFSLLGILEDFVAAPGRIRENAESLLKSSLGAYREETNTGTGPFRHTRARANLGESSWDLMAESSMMQASQGLQKGERIERAWDWRSGLVDAGVEEKGTEIVKLVREALVREVADGWGGKW